MQVLYTKNGNEEGEFPVHLTLSLVTFHSLCLNMRENKWHAGLNLLSGILSYSHHNELKQLRKESLKKFQA